MDGLVYALKPTDQFLIDSLERLFHCLCDPATPEEEEEAAFVEAQSLLEEHGRDPGDTLAHEARVERADRLHLDHKAIEILRDREWSLVPPGRRRVWQVLAKGRLVGSHEDPSKAVLTAAGFNVE